MPAVTADGFPPLVAALPIATSSRHRAEKTVEYVIVKRMALAALRFVALSTVVTVITARGLTELARANGSTVNRRSAKSVATVGSPSLNPVLLPACAKLALC
jgi:hypothetical protein